MRSSLVLVWQHVHTCRRACHFVHMLRSFMDALPSSCITSIGDCLQQRLLSKGDQGQIMQLWTMWVTFLSCLKCRHQASPSCALHMQTCWSLRYTQFMVAWRAIATYAIYPPTGQCVGGISSHSFACVETSTPNGGSHMIASLFMRRHTSGARSLTCAKSGLS